MNLKPILTSKRFWVTVSSGSITLIGVAISCLTIIFQDRIGLDEEMAKEVSEKIVYGVLAWVGAMSTWIYGDSRKCTVDTYAKRKIKKEILANVEKRAIEDQLDKVKQ